MNKLRSTPITLRLFMGFFFFCILLAALGYYTTQASMTALAEHTEESTRYIARKMVSDFNQEIDRKRRMLFLYVQGANIWEASDPAGELKRELLDNVEKEYGLRIFDRAILTDSEGTCIADTNYELAGNLSGETWWKEAKDSGYYEDATQENPAEMNIFFPLSVSIRDDTNTFTGVLTVYVNLSVFTQQIATSILPHRTSQIRVINSSGQLLFSTNPYSPYTDISGKDLWGRLKGSDEGYFLTEESGYEKILAYAKLNNTHRAEPLYFLIDSQVNEVYKSAIDLQRTNYTILGIVVLLGIIIAYFISRSITRPLSSLNSVVEQVNSENLTLRTNIHTSDEVGKISQSFDSMMDLLEEQTHSLKQQNWIETGQNAIGKTMRQEHDLSLLCSKVLTELSHYIGAAIGAVYLHREGLLKREGSFAFMAGKETPDTFALGEGFVGQAASEKKMVVINQFPDNYLFVGSSIGTGSPSTLLEVPILLNDELKGVIELGFTTALPSLWEELLAAVSRDFSLTIDSLQKSEIERELLKMTEEQRQELLSQQEELRVTNEELEEQTERLRLSEENLKHQQAELEEANAELEEKNVVLKENQAVIEHSREELSAKAEELNRESKYKSEFLSNMSHELRTPLNSLLLLSQDLMNNDSDNLTEEQIESAEIIYNGGKDLLSLINQILDMSKIEAGKIELHAESFLTENLRNILTNTFALEAKKKEIDFTIDFEESTPKKIITDIMRVEQILRNLISNAIKFTAKGGVSVQFGGEIVNQIPMLVIRVHDSGIGIPEKLQSEIFSAFHQGDSGTSRRFGGTGLGLTITKELVGLLGGTISLESVQNDGSTFTVCLPVTMTATSTESSPELPESTAQAEIPVSPVSREHMPVMTEETAGSGETYKPPVDDDRNSLKEGVKTILVIEDDVRFLSTVMKQCKARGYNCIGEASGPSGLKSARTYKPDGIILDLHLPGMDGYEVLDQLKNDTEVRHIPVHIMSVDDPSLKIFKQGAMGFLTKPVSKKSMDEALSKLISYSEAGTKRVLILEDDEATRHSLMQLLQDTNITVDGSGTGAEALRLVTENTYHCIVLDIGLPDMSGYDVIEKLQEMKSQKSIPPVIIYTGQDVNEHDILQLEESPQSVILKDVHSEERLLDEVTLFLHQMVGSLDPKKRQVITDLHNPDAAIAGHRILVVDDDMRALFAVAKLLGKHGLQVVKAESGMKALSLMESNMHFDLVLMDIMMPEMDGFETMQKIRALPQGKTLPMIALTAKAMKGDRDKCIQAGANDYLSKPIDSDKLLSLIHVWLYR